MKNGQLDVCNFYLKNNVKINPRDNGDWTPLHLAAQKSHKKVFKRIMDIVEEKNPWMKVFKKSI